MKKLAYIAYFLAFLGPYCWAADIVVQSFGGGLNTQDSSVSLDPSQAQDLLNVQFSPGGTAVFKRDGYGLFATLPISCSTCAVHGGYHFQQVGGNDVQLWGNDVELAGSVNDAAFVKLATGTVGATWQCADSQGSAYCLTSSQDMAVKTDGSVANTTYQNTIPLGTMLAFTPTQLVVAGVSGNENTIYVSGQNAFTNFTVGVLPSSPFTEPIASPGSRITHLAYYFGKLFWWKDQSFGYATFTNQFDWQLTIVSNQVGTLDNSDAFWNSSGFDSGTKFSGIQSANGGNAPGGIYFRGQDNHIYVYDGYFLTRLSRVISPSVTAASRRKSNDWKQTTQSDFQSGSIVPAGYLSTTISAGDVIPSSFSIVADSSSWNVPNPGFESYAGSTPNNWTRTGTVTIFVPGSPYSSGNSCTPVPRNPRTGSVYLEMHPDGVGTWTIELDKSDGTLINSHSETGTLGDLCTWNTITLSNNSTIGQTGKIKITNTDGTTLVSSTFTIGNDITLYEERFIVSGNPVVGFDDILDGASQFTSSATIFDNSGLVQSQASWSGSPSVNIQQSSSTLGAWSTISTSTGTNNSFTKSYIRYVANFTRSASDSSLMDLQNISVVGRSSGTFYSAVNNAPSLTSWGNLGITDSVSGGSAIAYYSRASTNSFTVLSSTPSWISQTKNAIVAASTGTYFQLRADFSLSAATETPALNDFTFNWFEGKATDKAYIAYFNDAVWFSVSSGTVGSNNRVFYWDILNGAWTMFDIPSNGFQIENNALYFGSPSNASIFKFGGVPTDNGLPINSYWRSKSFLGADPFVQNELIQADFVLGESSTTLNYTYTLDSKTSTTYAMTAYDSAASLIQRNFLLPVGKIGKYYDFEIGDNSSNQSWRMMAHRMHYNALNWKPVTQ